MIRSAQMLLGQAYISYYLKRNWRFSEEKIPQKIYDIINLFQDKQEAPFSIHKICQLGTFF